jgi:putative ABC transport system ATP-binding protein
MIALRDVRKVFNAGKANECEALRGVTLEVRRGRMTVFTGPSGSGKTTLLSMIAGMARPTSGRVFLSGREITSLPERFLADIRRKTFGFIFQQFHLIRGISALENVMAPAVPTGAAHRTLRDRAMGLLESQGIASKAAARVEWLSGGEAQRVAIARALVNDPPVVIADEPTAHLDTKLSMEFLASMERLLGEGRTILVASHDPIVSGWPLAGGKVEMRDGKVVTATGAGE